MKNKNLIQPDRRQISVLRQLWQLIPNHLVPKLARETGADDKARTFTPWSHVVAMLYAQISHALSLNDVCDALKLRLTAVFGVRLPATHHACTRRTASRQALPRVSTCPSNVTNVTQGLKTRSRWPSPTANPSTGTNRATNAASPSRRLARRRMTPVLAVARRPPS